MKPISPFDSAPVSAMNFPVSEYISAFRDAGKMQMAGQQAMMEGINKGVSSVTDYLEESRKSQAQANAFKPFFNKATLQNLMGISGDESAAVIEQFKNASTDEKIALGKVLTGTLVEAENQRKKLELQREMAMQNVVLQNKELAANQDIALATLAGKLGRPLYSSGGGGVSEAKPAEPALPAPGFSKNNEPSLFPPVPDKSGGGSMGPVQQAMNETLESAGEEEKQRQIAFNEATSTVGKNFEGKINEIYNTQVGTAQGDPYAEHEQMKKAKLAEIKALEDKALLYAPVDKKINETLLKTADNIRQNQPDLLKPFGELKEVSSIVENYRSPKIEGYKNKLTDLKTVVNTAREAFLGPDGKSAAISIIQKAVAPRLASLASDNALGETEARRLMDEISSVFGKDFVSRSFEKLKKGEGISGLIGDNVEPYLNRIDNISTDLVLRYNKNLEESVIKPLGSYAFKQGINPINLSEFGIKKPQQPDSIPGVEQNKSATKIPTKFRLKGGNIIPEVPLNEPSYNF